MKDSMKFPSDVVWLTSFPKSGATWTQSVVRNAGKNYEGPQIDLDVYNILTFWFLLVQARVQIIEFGFIKGSLRSYI